MDKSPDRNKIETKSTTPATSKSNLKNEWYADGLCFECTLSGNCCTGPPGYVWIDELETQAVADYLGISKTQFINQYTHLLYGRCSITETKTDFGYDCVFLDRTALPGKAVCGIYEVRPQQCRTWPFWPENLISEKKWENIGTNCPGINQGKLIPIEEIKIQRDTTPE